MSHFSVAFDESEGEYVARCDAFPSLTFGAPTEGEALAGMRGKVLSEVIGFAAIEGFDSAKIDAASEAWVQCVDAMATGGDR